MITPTGTEEACLAGEAMRGLGAPTFNPGQISSFSADPATGFLETTQGHYVTAFDADRKSQFIQVYKANGLRFKKTCKLLGISEHTINKHTESDKAFANALAEVRREYAEDLECTSMDIALTPKGFMDRIAQLRRFFPGRYAPSENAGQTKIELHIDGDLVLSKKHTETLEASIVGEIESAITDVTPLSVHQHPQAGQSSTESNSSNELRTDGEGRE